MSVPPELFDEDYLFFYADVLAPERSSADADLTARLLGLRTGQRVLDVPCGEGRIAGRLAQRGVEVVGLDSSELFLRRARGEWPSVTFVHGDMRELPYGDEFDAVLNWFTGFGYFDRETNDAVLAGFARALRPGGRLLLEMHNPGRLARLVALAGGESAYVIDRDGALMVDRIRYDPGEGFSHTTRHIIRDGQVRTLQFTLEQIPAPELVRRLQAAGFGAVECYGAGGERYDPEGRRLIAVAERASS